MQLALLQKSEDTYMTYKLFIGCTDQLGEVGGEYLSLFTITCCTGKSADTIMSQKMKELKSLS